MIKINSIVREIILADIEAVHALTHSYMNLSGYAYRIHRKVEKQTKKKVAINSLVVALSRLRQELKQASPLVRDVSITNITTKLPLSELVYENTSASLAKFESLHKTIAITRDDFFTTTVTMKEINIICSSSLHDKILKHFHKIKPKLMARDLAAVALLIDLEHFQTPNILFSLIARVARARINIVELVSTYSELIFVVAGKDFGKTVMLFSNPDSRPDDQLSVLV